MGFCGLVERVSKLDRMMFSAAGHHFVGTAFLSGAVGATVLVAQECRHGRPSLATTLAPVRSAKQANRSTPAKATNIQENLACTSTIAMGPMLFEDLRFARSVALPRAPSSYTTNTSQHVLT